MLQKQLKSKEDLLAEFQKSIVQKERELLQKDRELLQKDREMERLKRDDKYGQNQQVWHPYMCIMHACMHLYVLLRSIF